MASVTSLGVLTASIAPKMRRENARISETQRTTAWLATCELVVKPGGRSLISWRGSDWAVIQYQSAMDAPRGVAHSQGHAV